MSSSPAHVVQALRAVVGPATAPADGDLLEQFVRNRDERAFEVLVRRYGRVVHGACRRVLRDGSDVEDAWQATFLTLACKAAAIGEAQALAAWLHKVAVRIALRVRSDAAKRAWHEARAGGLRPDFRADEAFSYAARA